MDPNITDNQVLKFDDILNPIGLMEELIYGSLAGVAICLGGHPFE